MSSFTSIRSNLEQLPDEILLLICRYLSSTDILFSLYGLNSRLSQTISGYYQHVVLGHVPFKQFNFICTSILPEIGVNICSLVISNDWKGVLSTTFLNYFAKQMSVIFPRLKRLILTTFIIDSLMSFLDCLQNLSELYELKIMSLYQMGTSSTTKQILLEQIFTANNRRLTSIVFDDDSLPFSYRNILNTSFSHIEKLVIELNDLNDLHRLLTNLSQLISLDVNINEDDFELDDKIEYISIPTLSYFRLRSISHSWNFDELQSILKRIPNVQELIVQISTTYDDSLLDGQKMFSQLSTLSLTKFSYFLQCDNLWFADHSNILSSWHQFKEEFKWIKIDDDNTFVLYSLPVHCPYLILRYPTAKNKIFINDFGPQINCLTLFGVSTRIAETFSIINKCYKMRSLVLQVSEEIVPTSVQDNQLSKLPNLIFFVSLQPVSINTDDFRRLLELSPNLYHLAINYKVMKSLLDSESINTLLGHRITDLLIGIGSSSELTTAFISRLTTVCSRLKHLYFHLKYDSESQELLIMTVLSHLHQWKYLVSFGVANIKIHSTIFVKGIREWIIENSALRDNDTFLANYSTDTFRLWL